MDAITLVAYTFEIGSALVERCELVKQCHAESSRIAVRTLRVLASLENATHQFSGGVEFEASLTELKRALEEARDLVSRCQKARGVGAKIGALLRANTLKEGLVRVEGDLERVAADLQIPMLADIRKAVECVNECINERESESAAGPSGVDAEMLEQAVRAAIRKELCNTSQGRAVDEIIKDNLSKLYEAEAAVAEDQQGYSSPPDTAGGRPLLCSGHGEECALRTTKKEGPNLGRQFYCCPRTSRKEQCRMFAWVDECDRDGEKGTRSAGGGVASGVRGGDGRVCKKHNEPCAFFEVKKEGPNKGRHFYNCARAGTQRCSSFTWADKKPVAASTAATRGGERGLSRGGVGGSPAPVLGGVGEGGSGESKPLCKGHQEPCKLQITKKEGPNKGRPYYACPRPRSQSCNHFQWVKRG
ncbi:unnamed protein product [Ectocarpus fasciculatus]